MVLLMICLFVLGYVAIATEHQIHVNKAASALILCSLLWTIYIFYAPALNTPVGVQKTTDYVTKVELIEEGEEEPEEPITGEILTVSQALAKYDENQKQANITVKGFIVGSLNTESNYTPEFGTTTCVYNIFLSDNADEDNKDNCILIQLTTDIRAKFNLKDNPENYKKEVIITGSLEKYCQMAGIKTPKAAQFTGTTAIENVETEAENAVIYDLTGRRIDEITEAGIYIINGVKKIVR